MKKICEKCGHEVVPTSDFFRSKQIYCDKCSRKVTPPTQAELARRSGREFIDKVEIEANKASAENLSYGKYMARKEQKK